jgi:glycosyltransferase involved in cell wall biosynthesis
MPFFSVIIPLYNMERHIRRSLDSVLAQTFADFEVVVVDDGSTDNGPAIVQSYNDQRIRLVQQANAGVSAARNRGIAEAKGLWVAFLDADDEYRPPLLQRFHETISLFPEVGAVYSRLAICWGDKLTDISTNSNCSPMLVKDYFAFLLDGKNGGYGFHASSTTIRADVFGKAGLFPLGVKYAEDVDMWYRIAFSTSIATIPEALAIYHIEKDVQPRIPPPTIAYWFNTFDTWCRAGKIPSYLLDSVMRFQASERLSGAINNVLLNRRSLARQMLKEVKARDASPVLFVTTIIIVYLCPYFLLNFANKIRKSFR